MPLGNQNGLTGVKKILALGDDAFSVVEATLGVYATGGVAVAASDLFLRNVDVVIPVCASAGYTVAWDQVNKKIVVYQSANAVGAHGEVPNATNLSAVKVYLMALGKR